MPEVFQRAALNFGGGFSATRGILTFAGGSVAGLTPVLAQNLSLNFRQLLTRLYEIADGSAARSVYALAGRAEGDVAMARIIGPSVLLERFYRTYGDVCNMATNQIDVAPRSLCDPTLPAGSVSLSKYSLKYCLLTRVSSEVAAQDLIVGEKTQVNFGVLAYQDDTPQAPAPVAPRKGG